jgi:hypothetical protein
MNLKRPILEGYPNRALLLSLISIFVLMLGFNVYVFDAGAQQGGAATGGDAVGPGAVGGPANGGSATGQGAIGGAATGGSATAENGNSTSNSSNVSPFR